MNLLFFNVASATYNLRNLNTGGNVNGAASISANVPAAAPISVPTINERALEETSAPTMFPCNIFRWILWEDSAEEITANATELGYNEKTWDQPGTASIEDNSWWGLQNLGLNETAANIGWSANHWDCWVNHYEDYTWDEIVEWGLNDAFNTLGYDARKWDSKNFQPLKDAPKWEDLTSDEKWAADQICYVPDSWEHKLLEDWVWTCLDN